MPAGIALVIFSVSSSRSMQIVFLITHEGLTDVFDCICCVQLRSRASTLTPSERSPFTPSVLISCQEVRHLASDAGRSPFKWQLLINLPCVHSGRSGFDETVVLTDLRHGGDPTASSIVSKFDAHDVVSSLRWSPDESQLSWTTDGGDFQIADARTRSSQLQIPLYTYLVSTSPSQRASAHDAGSLLTPFIFSNVVASQFDGWAVHARVLE